MVEEGGKDPILRGLLSTRGKPTHYGTGHFEKLKIHCPTSEGVSEVSKPSERVSAVEGASKASSLEQANE